MNRQRGVASLALVLMLLVLGSLMLHGLNQLQRRQLSMVTNETQAINDTARAHDALQWGKRLAWALAMPVECRTDDAGSRVCLRLLADDGVLLIAASNGMVMWQSGKRESATVRFSAHGWSDFCPQKEATLCQLP